MGFVSSLFVHKISLKYSRETAAFNLFQASLLSRVVGEFHFFILSTIMVYKLL